MSVDLGYYVHIVDAHLWITRAQKSLAIKNKVRKELWQELVDVIHWDPIPVSSRRDYLRIPQMSFVSLQTFCLIDGKGADNVSSDQLLNFCTTLSDLRSKLPVVRLVQYTNRPLENLPDAGVTIHNPIQSLVDEYKEVVDAPVEEEEAVVAPAP